VCTRGQSGCAKTLSRTLRPVNNAIYTSAPTVRRRHPNRDLPPPPHRGPPECCAGISHEQTQLLFATGFHYAAATPARFDFAYRYRYSFHHVSVTWWKELFMWCSTTPTVVLNYTSRATGRWRSPAPQAEPREANIQLVAAGLSLGKLSIGAIALRKDARAATDRRGPASSTGWGVRLPAPAGCGLSALGLPQHRSRPPIWRVVPPSTRS
jgi:hypothetical protein